MLGEGANAWLFLIPLLPLLAGAAQTVSLGLLRWAMPRRLSLAVSCGTPAFSFVASFVALVDVAALPEGEARLVADGFTWFAASDFGVEMALLVDPLSASLACAAAAVAALLHLHAAGILADDPHEDGGVPRFLAYANLLTGAVLTLILAENPLVLFLGWQLATVASSLLVGFWYAEQTQAEGATQAFAVGLLGDAAILLGILVLAAGLGATGQGATFFPDVAADFATVADRTVALPGWLGGAIHLPTFVGALFALAASTRVAQLPFVGWLRRPSSCPDPALALLHVLLLLSAVGLLARFSFVLAAAPAASAGLAWVGVAVAFVAAVRAGFAVETRSVLSLVAVSQAGLALAAMGIGAYAAGVFLAVTQGFGIAALHAASGTVSQVLRGEIRLKAMGGLWSSLHRTKWAFAAAGLSVAGAPFLSGFYALDAVLVAGRAAVQIPDHGAFFALGLAVVPLVAYALVRLHVRIFLGRGRAALHSPLREPSGSVLGPVYALAFIAAVGGFLGPRAAVNPFPVDDAVSNSFANFLDPLLGSVALPDEIAGGLGVPFVALVLAALAGAAAVVLQQRRPEWADAVRERLPTLHRVLSEGRAIDRLAVVWVGRPVRWFAERFFVPAVEDAGVQAFWERAAAGAFVRRAAVVLRPLQEGGAQAWTFWLALGTLALVAYGVTGP